VTLDTYTRYRPTGTPVLKLVDCTNKMKLLLLMKLITDSCSHLRVFSLLIFM